MRCGSKAAFFFFLLLLKIGLAPRAHLSKVNLEATGVGEEVSKYHTNSSIVYVINKLANFDLNGHHRREKTWDKNIRKDQKLQQEKVEKDKKE